MNHAEGPSNGDFVAYIDRLQKESEARLRAQTGFAPHVTAAPPGPRPQAEIVQERTPQRGQPVGLRQLLRSLPPRTRFVLAGAALGLGAFLSMLSLSFEGIALTLFLSAGLLVWALSAAASASAASASKDASHLHRLVAGRFGGRDR